ncbi:MAG TPA: hypothetical protein VE153_18320 [Myxococcus sp.]|nr:hypothetical protein [Myxococcus sp.]
MRREVVAPDVAEGNDAHRSEQVATTGGCGWREGTSLVADGLGIIGFLITYATFRAVGRLRRDVLSRARLPSHISALEKYATELNSRLNDLEDNRASIGSTLAELDSTLSEILALTGGEQEAKAKALRHTARVFSKDGMHSKDQGWAVHAGINGLVVALQNFVANQQVMPKS